MLDTSFSNSLLFKLQESLTGEMNNVSIDISSKEVTLENELMPEKVKNKINEWTLKKEHSQTKYDSLFVCELLQILFSPAE